MEIINASITKLYPESQKEARDALIRIEQAGRTCYKSEAKANEESAPKFAKMVLGRGHESVVEHVSASFRIVCDRGVSHEIVRHRIGCSFSQESTRYVNYYKRGMRVVSIRPTFPNISEESEEIWRKHMEASEITYNALIANGCTPEMARSVLPNSLKTEIVMTATIPAWRHFCNLRCSPKAHPQMREIANEILKELNVMWPELFEDIVEKYK